MDDDDFTVDDGLAFDIKGPGNPGELADPVVAIARVGAAIVPVDPELDAVAIVFDFVNPRRTRRRLHLQGRKLGTDEPRHLRGLRPRGRCLGTLRHATQLTKNPPPSWGRRRAVYLISSTSL